jgi:SpoVK/Ycf46/Vps4 family AAA+-type ATPase
MRVEGRFHTNLEILRAAAQRLVALSNDDAPANDPRAHERSHAARADGANDLEFTEEDLALASHTQWTFLWAVAAHSFDPRCAAHLGAVFGNAARAGLSVAQHALLAQLNDDDTAAVLEVIRPQHPFIALGLLLTQDDASPHVSTPWRTPARLWDHLRGASTVDANVVRYGGVRRPAGQPTESASQRAVGEKLAGWLGANEPYTIVLSGTDGDGRVDAVARASARPIVFADFRRVPSKAAPDVIVAVQREAQLQQAIPILAHLDAVWGKLEASADMQLTLASLLSQTRGPLVVTTSAATIELGDTHRTVVRQHWPLPDNETRQALWRQAFQGAGQPLDLCDEELSVIATRYAFGVEAIAASVRSSHRHAEGGRRRAPSFSDVVAGVRDNIAERFGEVARRVEVSQTWDELVLSPETQDDVTALINRVKHAHQVLEAWGFRTKLARGTGTAALFSGPPGTGKTMVAGLIARELQLELYQIDLSKIVSKWVGETEKQLARVFEAAEAGHALLLFDEADALFAKRSAEVKSAVDRYANLEVNYLLQRVESFGGVVILTTNLDASIDPALRRRLAGHITFGAPDEDERVRLWRQMIASQAPLQGDLDLEGLAREFDDMTGANIRNAVLAAAFLAAGEQCAISSAHLLRGARGEYRAMGRVLSKGQAR